MHVNLGANLPACYSQEEKWGQNKVTFIRIEHKFSIQRLYFFSPIRPSQLEHSTFFTRTGGIHDILTHTYLEYLPGGQHERPERQRILLSI